MSAIADEMRAMADAQLDPAVQQMLRWASTELDDRAETIADLDQEIREYSDGYGAMVNALNDARESLESAVKDITLALWKPPQTAIDLAPFKNVMAAHGVAPYAPKKRTKAVTT